MDFSEHRRFAERHGRRRAAERDHVELEAWQDERDARRDPGPMARRVSGRISASLKSATRRRRRRGARRGRGTRAPPSGPSPARRGLSPRANPVRCRARTEDAEIDGRRSRSRKAERHDEASLRSGGHEAVHGDSWRAPGDKVAAIRAEPCDMVQPICPCPQLRKRFFMRRRPMSGRLVGVIGRRPAHISARSYSAPSGKSPA